MVPDQRIGDFKRCTRWCLSVVIGALVITGCTSPFGQEGYLRDRAADYTKARTTAPTQLPAGTEARELGEILPIPESRQADKELTKDYVVPKPSRRLVIDAGQYYSLEHSGQQEWLSTAHPPADIWPSVLAYIDQLGPGFSSQDSTQRMVETRWYEFSGEEQHGAIYRTVGRLFGVNKLEPMEDRFRFEVRNGIENGTAEVHVYHQGRPMAKKGRATILPLEWDNLGERSKQLDSAILADLMVYLAQNQNQTTASSQNVDTASRSEISQDGNGNPILTIRGLSYARAWDEVSGALDAAGLKVIDRNRSVGLFYLAESEPQLAQPDKKTGFWSGWFGAEDVDESKTLTVRVSSYSDAVQLSVEKDINTSAPADISRALLETVKDNLQ